MDPDVPVIYTILHGQDRTCRVHGPWEYTIVYQSTGETTSYLQLMSLRMMNDFSKPNTATTTLHSIGQILWGMLPIKSNGNSETF